MNSLDNSLNTSDSPAVKNDMNEGMCQLKIGFIGAGNMAFGIAQGILTSGKVPPTNIIVSAPSMNNLPRFQLLPVDTCLIRIMPNLPCILMEGALLLACGSRAGQEEESLLKNLLSPCGLVETGPEHWIDAHTGLSGSGVAFVYVFAEALAEGAVKMGMPSTLARRIAAQTILGAGVLLRDTGKLPAELKAEVCTPGGTTIHGLHALEKGGFRAAAMGAVEAATERARELGKK
ncbi:pyrroline-5-carboxylate reductase 3 isoform X2 [Myxocyprinus asiaticus]|uniref:pyrroline-5-carboxylate reductase 3 isoform X2 n=1 Tax=Myxocyprinus asiaticus TaxID=70543 RepID=UPI002221F84E|nr:pyrroline-5-carboxylate reductase 3 isoform X2 [Myxocyprinus asiaticus]